MTSATDARFDVVEYASLDRSVFLPQCGDKLRVSLKNIQGMADVDAGIYIDDVDIIAPDEVAISNVKLLKLTNALGVGSGYAIVFGDDGADASEWRDRAETAIPPVTRSHRERLVAGKPIARKSASGYECTNGRLWVERKTMREAIAAYHDARAQYIEYGNIFGRAD